MYQGTTPLVTIEVDDFDATGMTTFVTFKQRKKELTKTGDDVGVVYDSDTGKSTVVCRLTQEETLAMRRGYVRIQIRFIDSDELAYTTDETGMDVDEALYKAVIQYDGGGE